MEWIKRLFGKRKIKMRISFNDLEVIREALNFKLSTIPRKNSSDATHKSHRFISAKDTIEKEIDKRRKIIL